MRFEIILIIISAKYRHNAFKLRIDTALILWSESNEGDKLLLEFFWRQRACHCFSNLSQRRMRVLRPFLIICRISGSIWRIDAMTKVLIKSEWWNFSVHYINLNDVQFYPLYTMEWNGTRRFALIFTHLL